MDEQQSQLDIFHVPNFVSSDLRDKNSNYMNEVEWDRPHLIGSSLTVVGLEGYHLPEPEPGSGAAGEHKLL